MVLSRFLALCLFIASTIAQPVDGNAPSSAIPIAVGGKDPEIAKAVIALMLPEYDVVHVVHNAPVALSELIPLLAGENTIPASMLGSNSKSAMPQVPKAIFVGGGFSESEIISMYNGTSLQMVPWVYPLTQKRVEGTIPPTPEIIVARVKQVFAENGFVAGNEDNVKPGVWAF
ncbi:unnamed protein product [Zymoseptoria tritici ST99CH_1A5]|uniref:Uncharacterized protein n=2 Tax=Zymoseptoria tritici TaxID=1047171 RepID=A0A2H1GPD8_ZYMTR|nr:unnamed protein product [Zymoseptoria tritici ST99CH_1E4]SMR57838.1 unnamed protein product [Zymoseptoria tritici ST99CH_3D1]SMY26274.1 unnamed protein product [Zymoseptoria tritici ST99CH_1A5]